MSDSLQKIIKNLWEISHGASATHDDITAHEVASIARRLETLQKQPIAWMTEDRVLIKNYFGDKTDRTNLIPLIRAD